MGFDKALDNLVKGKIALDAGSASTLKELVANAIRLGGSFPVYVLAYLMMGGYTTARGLALAQGRSLAQAGNMGAGYGLMETVMALAIVVGPPLAGYLYSIQPEWVYITSLGLIVAGLIANWVYSPVRKADIQAFEERERTEWTQT